jgi:hypothetical protein
MLVELRSPKPKVGGSIPSPCAKGPQALLAMQLPCKQRIHSSILWGTSKKLQPTEVTGSNPVCRVTSSAVMLRGCYYAVVVQMVRTLGGCNFFLIRL